MVDPEMQARGIGKQAEEIISCLLSNARRPEGVGLDIQNWRKTPL